jgi:hypothetical protein
VTAGKFGIPVPKFSTMLDEDLSLNWRGSLGDRGWDRRHSASTGKSAKNAKMTADACSPNRRE